ncbi:MAG: inositol monophosphatase [Pirellulales bacterium]|nr:inositol monophosphatase [Pirellulales bacterium]
MLRYIEICEKAVRAGGTTLIERLGSAHVWQKSPADLVTDADLASQEIVTRILRQAFPAHEVLGEEDVGDEAGETSGKLEAEFCWVLDPLDGTTNFAHGVPHFSVSLALLHRGEPLVGSVFDPLRDELFSAVAGRGASLNGKHIRTSNVATASEAVAAIGFPPGVNENSPDLKAFLRAIPRFQALRRTGSAALNLAYVAMGRYDASWSYSTRIWDMAAGVLLVRESDGTVCSPKGEDLDLRSGQFLVSATGKLNQEIQLLLNTPSLDAER